MSVAVDKDGDFRAWIPTHLTSSRHFRNLNPHPLKITKGRAPGFFGLGLRVSGSENDYLD
jgi:hypothetical protein